MADPATNAASAATEELEGLDFSLHNRLDQPMLFTRLPRQAVRLQLKNTSRDEITIPAVPDQPSDDPYPHLVLAFAAGTLWEKTIRLEEETAKKWSITNLGEQKDHFDRYEIRRKTDLTLKPGETSLKPGETTDDIQMEGLQIDGRGGSRGTHVELVYKNLASAGHEGKLSGQRAHWISVMDEGPADLAPNLPIRVDLIGGNTLLNDDQPHSLTLQLLCQEPGGLKLPQGAKITLEFPIADATHPWGLLQKNSGLVDGSGNGIEASGKWDISIKRAGDEKSPPQLVLTNTAESALDDGDAIRIPLTLRTKAPSGYSFVDVTYEGFGNHLSDTQQARVLKSPLVVGDTKVGIGTTTPGFPLTFKDEGGDKISLFGQSGDHYGFGIGSGLLQIHTSRVGSDIAFGYGQSASMTETMRIKGNGNVGIGTPSPDRAKLEVRDVAGSNYAISAMCNDGGRGIEVLTSDFDYAENKGGGLTIQPSSIGARKNGKSQPADLGLNPTGGNVGIGTPTPGFPLTFKSELGDKISLYGQSGNHYGFGIQGYTLQIHTDTVNADVAFGYGHSASMTETMRIKGNGNVITGTALIGNLGVTTDLKDDYASFSHKSQATDDNYALYQNSAGSTYLNAAYQKAISFRINNATKMALDGNGLKVGGGTALKKIIAGGVSEGGSSNGAGFTSKKTGTGKYQVTISPKFSNPVVVATIAGSGDRTDNMISVHSHISGNSTILDFSIYDTGDTKSFIMSEPRDEDAAFNFIAIDV